MRVRIKFCGITRAEDAVAAAETGADAIGLVFHAESQRRVTPEQAAAICSVLPPFVTRVGLFVDPDPAAVRNLMQAVTLDLLQFHGSEPAALCTQFGTPYLKAVRVRETADVIRAARDHPAAAALLLDSCVAHAAGGTGRAFPWSLIPERRTHRIVLAGGLNPDNVQAAIAAVRPYAVDVSSGIETQPGIKDQDRMRRFVAAVLAAGDCAEGAGRKPGASE